LNAVGVRRWAGIVKNVLIFIVVVAMDVVKTKTKMETYFAMKTSILILENIFVKSVSKKNVDFKKKENVKGFIQIVNVSTVVSILISKIIKNRLFVKCCRVVPTII